VPASSFAPVDIIWGPREYVQPDLFVVPAHEVTGDWRDCRTPLLAVEVVSPGSARADRPTKRRLYQRRGVETYWIADPDADRREGGEQAEPGAGAGYAALDVVEQVFGLSLELVEAGTRGELPG
jgi:Uma2 family endonuclease